jgi:membrane-associated phospholipid phosphatase
MTSLAIFDAVNSIDRSYEQYLLKVPGQHRLTTSIDAAVASAAHDVLAALYPAQQSMLDAALADSLAAVPDGARETRGVALGQQTAAAMLQARENDGSGDVVTYTVNPAAGHWSPDPYNPTQIAWGAGWGYVTPFALQSTGLPQAPPPPALDSVAYAKAYNQAKSIGDKDSTTRTADQTQVALFWAYDDAGLGTPPGEYDQQVEVIAKQNHNSLVENARLFALVNMAQADAGIASWHSKYVYDFWRPVTAIQRGGEDGNPLTTADANWEPMGAPGFNGDTDFTPPFPAYVSGHATFGAAVYKVLADYYHTDRMHFTLASDQMPGVTRSFDRFSQAADENAMSRIYMGVHWIFDAEAGQCMGRSVGDITFDHQLEPVHHGPGDGGGPSFMFARDVGETFPAQSLVSQMGLTDKNDDLFP